MSTTATAGRIETRDIDELQQVVQPWDVILRQMSLGRLHTRMDYVQVNGILLYREDWSHRIIATGATPPGFFFFGGPISSKTHVGWCGSKLSPECLAFGRSSTETDFVTSDGETHICLLVPEDLMLRYLGEELAERVIPKDHFLSCRHGYGNQLLQMMARILDKYFVHRKLLGDDQVCKAIEWQLLGGLVEFMLTSAGESTCLSQSARYLPVLRAMKLCENLRRPITVSELAAASGVSKRVLELGFQEVTKTTPRDFMRWDRLNWIRKELLAADSGSASVTQIAGGLGITELGRFAVEYKRLFCESPSTTLSREFIVPPRRFSDVLQEASDR